MKMLNKKCQTSFVKPEYLKKAKQSNPRLYDIGCYNDNLTLMLSPESDEVIRLEKESRSKLRMTKLDLFLDMEIVGNKMHKAFLLPGESSHWQYKFPLLVEGVPTAKRMEIPLPGVCTAMMKKLPVKDRWQLH
nr:hypothetical protein [Tanacetum cinerariifolium]